MAQTLGQAARQYSPEFEKTPPGGTTNTAVVNGEFEYADLTSASTVATGGNGDFGFPCNYFRAVVNIKTFTQGTAASVIYIECADDAAMTINARRPALSVLPIAAGPFTLVLAGVVPDGGKRYARISFGAGAGASATYDAFLSACP